MDMTKEVSPTKDVPLSMRLQVGWGLGSLAMTLMQQANVVLLLRYFVDYVGIAAVAAGGIIGFCKRLCRNGKILSQTAAHAHRLCALSGKEKCDLFQCHT